MKRRIGKAGGVFHFGLLTLGLLVCGSVSVGAQNLLRNGNFEQPLGPDNWTVIYLHGGPDDFEIKDRIRGASRQAVGHATLKFGGCFRPITLKLAHACFTQVVTNLTPGHLYWVGGYMKEDWWKGVDDPKRDKYLVYIEAIGGMGTPTEDGRRSMIATNALDPDANIDPPYTYPTDIWREFFTQQTPDAEGKIEVRLHYNKVGSVIYDKTWIMAGYFDDVYLTP